MMGAFRELTPDEEDRRRESIRRFWADPKNRRRQSYRNIEAHYALKDGRRHEISRQLRSL
jgi:hypothetical protein